MIDFTTLRLNWKPNQFLLAPAGLCGNAQPHMESPVFKYPPQELMKRVREIALSQPRVTEQTAADSRETGAVFVARSKVFRFPDVIDVQAIDAGDGHSALAIYSRARVGIRDFGVNRKRIEDWISRLQK